MGYYSSSCPQNERCDPTSLMLLSARRCAGGSAKEFRFYCLFLWSVVRMHLYLAGRSRSLGVSASCS